MYNCRKSCFLMQGMMLMLWGVAVGYGCSCSCNLFGICCLGGC